MLGGIDITRETLAHADQMLKTGTKNKRAKQSSA
jgi:hypothetical protein